MHLFYGFHIGEVNLFLGHGSICCPHKVESRINPNGSWEDGGPSLCSRSAMSRITGENVTRGVGKDIYCGTLTQIL